MRVVHVNVVQPQDRPEPEVLLSRWRTVADVAEAVACSGCEVAVVQPFHRDAEVVRGSVRYRFVREPILSGRATGYRPDVIRRAVGDLRPDVIHVNGLDFWRHIPALCRIGVPVLAQDHASRAGIARRRRRRALARISGVAFTAQEQARPFVAEGSIARDVPVFDVPESSTRFSPGSREDARAVTGVFGDPAVLWVGRLDCNKDPLTVLAAIERASAALPNLQGWFCFHEAPLLNAVRQRIQSSERLAGRIHLLGRTPHAEVETLCRAADVFMLGSHREGSGYALIEALACGAVPIVSDIAPFRALTAGKIGALVEPGDVDGFARALVTLARRPLADLRRDALAHFNAQLSFERVGARLKAIYATMIEAAQ